MLNLYRLEKFIYGSLSVCQLLIGGMLIGSLLFGCAGKSFRRAVPSFPPASESMAQPAETSFNSENNSLNYQDNSTVSVPTHLVSNVSTNLEQQDGLVQSADWIDLELTSPVPNIPLNPGSKDLSGNTTSSGGSVETDLLTSLSVQSERQSEEDVEDVPAPEPVTGKLELSLDQAIALTLANDPVLRAGLQEIQQSYAEQVTASLKPNPEVEVIQSLLPLGQAFNEFDRQGGPPQFDFFVSYPVDWYWFGKRAAAMQATLLNRMATELEFADLLRQRILLTSVSYFDALEQQALLELAEQDAENLFSVEEITQTAVENGAMPRVDFSRIRLDRLNSDQTVRETRRDLVAAKAALMVAMGLEGSGLDFDLAGELPEPLDDQYPELEQLFGVAQSNRPDIAALRSRINEARANMTLEYREAFPEITPMMGYTRQFQERAIGFPSVSSWGVGLSMTLPFYDRNQGNRLRAASERVQRMEELRAGLVELRGELIEVLAELEAARANAISTADEQLVLAAEVRDGIREAYQVGDRPLIDVLDSQRNFRETYRNFINSRADYWRAVQRYQAALANQ